MTPKQARLDHPDRPSQQAVAAKAGISLSTIVRAEHSGTWPRQQRTRRAYQAALDVAPAPLPAHSPAVT